MNTAVRSLKGDRSFRRLTKARSGGSKHLSLRWRATRSGEVRVGIVVNRKVGKAVTRNRVRRRLREAMLAIVRDPRWLPMLATVDGAPSFDALIVVRPSAVDASYRELKRSLELAMERGRLP